MFLNVIKIARFAKCYNISMDMDNLVKLRNYLECKEGCLLITYMSDYITENACKNREASEIKGMCELLHRIKSIPNEVNKRK